MLVQDPREATHEGMPRAVIAAEIADLVLPVREIAARLGELARHKEKLAPLMPPPSGDAHIGKDDELVLKRIFDLVRLRTDHDFSRYSAANIGTDKAGADKGAALCFSKRGHSLGELGSFWRTYGPELVAHQAIPFDG